MRVSLVFRICVLTLLANNANGFKALHSLASRGFDVPGEKGTYEFNERLIYNSNWTPFQFLNWLSGTFIFYIGHASCTDLLPGNYCQIIAHDAPEDCLNPGIEKECCASCKSVDTKALSEDRQLRLSTSSCLVHYLFEIVYLKLWAKMFLYWQGLTETALICWLKTARLFQKSHHRAVEIQGYTKFAVAPAILLVAGPFRVSGILYHQVFRVIQPWLDLDCISFYF